MKSYKVNISYIIEDHEEVIKNEDIYKLEKNILLDVFTDPSFKYPSCKIEEVGNE